MKKLLTLILSAVLMLSSTVMLASCGGSGTQALKVIDISLTSEEYAFAVKKDDAELLQQLNEFLKVSKADGTFDKVVSAYFGEGEKTPVVSAKQDSSKDQLVVATNAGFAPFEYMDGESFLGIDMELMKLFADSLGKELVISNMEFESVCTSVAEGLCDVAAAGLTINETRKAILDFSDPYYNASQALVVKGDDTTFDACKTKEDVEAILNTMTADTKIGVQNGTTGMFYVSGDEGWGFPGFPVTCVPYDVAALAAQDMLNGNANYVIIDVAPANEITKSINERN